jgi:hypothetical protein
MALESSREPNTEITEHFPLAPTATLQQKRKFVRLSRRFPGFACVCSSSLSSWQAG